MMSYSPDRFWSDFIRHILVALPGPILFKGADGFNKISGRKGIIFFKDHYGTGDQGEHIDLWNESRLTKYKTWIEFAFRGGKHYAKADIWFWPLAD